MRTEPKPFEDDEVRVKLEVKTSRAEFSSVGAGAGSVERHHHAVNQLRHASLLACGESPRQGDGLDRELESARQSDNRS